jgi:glycosyltransferase involved in cell wall biosynthesis/O-antigen/teichoic acid export membrane protein
MINPLHTTRHLVATQRICQAITGGVTLLLLLELASTDALGWYYSFVSFGALYMVFDHGLSGVLVNKAAAEISRVKTSSFAQFNERERLACHKLCYASFKLYKKICLTFWITITPLGLYFFSHETSPFHSWALPWIAFTTALAFNLLLLPFSSIIEGGGAINAVYLVRLSCGLCGALICWLLILSGSLLWATIAVPLTSVVIQLCWILVKWKKLIDFIFIKPVKEMEWGKTMLPLEIRVAITILSVYALNQLITLILFQTHGAATAGVMAVSLTLANMIALISFSAITSSVPRITRENVLNKWESIDRTFRIGVSRSSKIYFFATTCFCLILLSPISSSVTERILPIELMVILFVAIFASHLVTAITLKLRSYLSEPLMPVYVVAAVILLSSLILLIDIGGLQSATYALVISQCFFSLPVSFIVSRKFQLHVRHTLRKKHDALDSKQQTQTVKKSEPSVAILMTTFNGEQYLREQLASIENQHHSNWHLYISDDGSTDQTLIILEQFASKHVDRVTISTTKYNLGFVKNFLKMIADDAITASYFALCDQDDIWCVDKLSSAIQMLESSDAGLSLYCGRTLLVDEKGSFTGHSKLFTKRPHFRNALVQNIGGGNTMVFSQAVKDLLTVASRNVTTLPSHDWWIYIVVSAAEGHIIYDTEPRLLYRQHGRNLVGTNIGLYSIANRVLRLRDGHFREWCQQHINALNSFSAQFTEENKAFFQAFTKLRKSSIWYRGYHALKNTFYRQTLAGNIALKIAMMTKKI